MSTYQFLIVTPDGKVFDEQIEGLVAPGLLGYFGVLARHTPMIASLKKGPLKLKKNDAELYYAVSSGLLEVNVEGSVLLLSDYAVKAQNNDDAKMKAMDFR